MTNPELSATIILRDTDRAATVLEHLFQAYFDKDGPDLHAIRHDWHHIYNFIELAHMSVIDARDNATTLSKLE